MKNELSLPQVRLFRRVVYRFYRRNRRSVLPWRATTDPYKILVSEIMLQQTQVERVAEKYPVFIRRFPTVAVLASAPLSAVLKAWQGLGYNRRALFLRRAAAEIIARHKGKIPCDEQALDDLSGIGQATASSIMAFAFDYPSIFIETNIRSVFIHYFFPGKTGVTDAQLMPFVRQAVDKDSPRRWYSALMDYGASLKKSHQNPGRRSAHHVRQKAFEGSDRQVRGRIVKLLVGRKQAHRNKLLSTLPFEPRKIERAIEGLVKEGLVRETRGVLSL